MVVVFLRPVSLILSSACASCGSAVTCACRRRVLLLLCDSRKLSVATTAASGTLVERAGAFKCEALRGAIHATQGRRARTSYSSLPTLGPLNVSGGKSRLLVPTDRCPREH